MFTLAASFIVSCPASNAALPFTPFPALAYNATTCSSKRDDDWYGQHGSCGPPSAGDNILLTAAGTIPQGSYVTFISGLAIVSLQGDISGNTVTVTIPDVAMGQTYVLITNSDVEGTLMDSAVLFGPAIVEVMPPAPTV